MPEYRVRREVNTDFAEVTLAFAVKEVALTYAVPLKRTTLSDKERGKVPEYIVSGDVNTSKMQM